MLFLVEPKARPTGSEPLTPSGDITRGESALFGLHGNQKGVSVKVDGSPCDFLIQENLLLTNLLVFASLNTVSAVY